MKPLIVFYSHSGNTRRVAQAIAALIGGDCRELLPVSPYPTDYDTVVEQARKEIRQGFLPELQPLDIDWNTYDTVLIGTPNWWSTMAPPVAAFLRQTNLSGKGVALFCTHGGGGLARVARDAAKECPSLDQGAAFDIYGDGGNAPEPKLRSWLDGLGLISSN